MIDTLVTDTEFIFKLKGREMSVGLKKMRLACPCAHCQGEKDIFGNVYKGRKIKLNGASFQMHAMRPVGNYAIQVFWKDRHTSGIYTFEHLKNISE